jgi:lipid II:glycine glycyltransferase (peptidoglycan interpeptide bridge formation enzyme)
METLLFDRGYRKTDRARTYRTIAVDLSSGEGNLLKNLDGKWRTDLNFAKKADLAVDVGATADLFSRFQSLYESMRERKGFSSVLEPEFFFKLHPESIGLRVMIAHRHGRDAAGHVESMLGGSAIYLFGASNEVGRQAKAAYLLNWLALVHAQERGVAWYDLGGIDPVANPGVYRFKGRMGGQEMEAAGPYEARPSGFLASALLGLESAHARIRQA